MRTRKQVEEQFKTMDLNHDLTSVVLREIACQLADLNQSLSLLTGAMAEVDGKLEAIRQNQGGGQGSW